MIGRDTSRVTKVTYASSVACKGLIVGLRSRRPIQGPAFWPRTPLRGHSVSIRLFSWQFLLNPHVVA
jgi:hypothetical protein